MIVGSVVRVRGADAEAAEPRLYQAAGFRLMAEERHHSFGHDLEGQNLERDRTTG